MPKIKCKCGEVINLSQIPDDGFMVIRDKDYEKVIEMEIELSKSTDADNANDTTIKILN